MRLPLTIDLDRQLLVGGLNNTNPATLPKLKQGDDVDVVLQAVEQNSSTVVQFYRAVPLPFTTIKCAVTVGADAPPTDGTIRVALVGGAVADVTGPFAPAITKADLETRLNALPGVTAKGGVKVLTDNKATNIFRLRWNLSTETATFEFRDNLLEPPCDVRYSEVDLPNGRVQLLKYRQQPLAFTDDFALPSVPPVTVASVRVGTGTGNCIQSIGVPRAAVGSVHFVFAGLSTAVLPVASVSASAIATALNGIYADGVTRFAVTQASSTVFYVEFVGPLALTNFPLLGAEMHDQEPPQTPTGKLPLNWASLEMALDGQKEITLLLEIEITDEEGNVGTPVQSAITIVNDAIDGGMSLVGNPPWQDPGSPTYVPPGGNDNPVILAPGAYVTPVGAGSAVGTSGKDFVITHNLGTSNVLVGVRETGGTHLRIPDNQYACTILNDNQVEVVFANAPTLNQYYVVIAAVIPATMALPPHHHQISDIDGLQAILNALQALGNPADLWPSIPDSKLPRNISWTNADDGSFRFIRLPKELLPLGVPYYSDGPPPGIYVDYPDPVGTIMLYDADGRIPVERLPLDPSNWPGLEAAILKVLQSNAGLIPPGLVPIKINDRTETYPPAVTLRAGTAAQIPTLARALPNFTSGGNVSGALPLLPLSNLAGAVALVVNGASATAVPYRAPKFFTNGEKVGCDGNQFYKVFVDGANAYPSEMERELFIVRISEKMLAANCRFAVNAQLTLALTGPCAAYTEGQYTLRAAFGHTTGPALSAVVWDTDAISETLIIGDAGVTHTFGVAVQRSVDGATRTAQARFYGRDTSTTAPTANDFVVGAWLTKFDVTDVPFAQGQIALALKGTASVVDLSKTT